MEASYSGLSFLSMLFQFVELTHCAADVRFKFLSKYYGTMLVSRSYYFLFLVTKVSTHCENLKLQNVILLKLKSLVHLCTCFLSSFFVYARACLCMCEIAFNIVGYLKFFYHFTNLTLWWTSLHINFHAWCISLLEIIFWVKIWEWHLGFCKTVFKCTTFPMENN